MEFIIYSVFAAPTLVAIYMAVGLGALVLFDHFSNQDPK